MMHVTLCFNTGPHGKQSKKNAVGNGIIINTVSFAFPVWK